MSRRGNCLDNAPMESFFASLKKEHVHHVRFRTRAEARAAVFEYIEGHRQVAAGEDREAPLLIGATASCGSLDARDLGPDREGLRADGSVLGGREVIAVEVEEVVDLVVGGEEPLRLAG